MTRALQELVDAGYVVTPEIIARLSPYKTEHINRFAQFIAVCSGLKTQL
jgi:Tn3 transposase DDE domain